MAKIDELRTAHYAEYNDFRVWCISNRPSLLNSFCEPFLFFGEWERLQGRQGKYNDYRDDAKITIAYFLSHEDEYLYWHCPIGFVREYLETQCGYKKANWFVKLFWKK
mgnify:CR=1 FL=1